MGWVIIDNFTVGAYQERRYPKQIENKYHAPDRIIIEPAVRVSLIRNQRQPQLQRRKNRQQLRRRQRQPLQQLMLSLIVKLTMAVAHITAIRSQLIASVLHAGH